MKTLPSKSCLWHLNHFVKNYYPMYQSNGDMIENCLFFITMISRDKSRKEKVLSPNDLRSFIDRDSNYLRSYGSKFS